jgi:Tol biopolymer transport system component
MRQWLTTLTLTIAIAVSGIQTNAQPQPLTIHWLSNSNGSPLNTDSRFPSISADGTRVVFQVGNGRDAEIWEWQQGQSQAQSVKDPQNPSNPIKGIHPVISADGNHIAFASGSLWR